MLRPFLIIGVGGSGGKTLRGIKYQLELKLQQVGWKSGIPAAWQFLHFDTPTAQDGVDFAVPVPSSSGVPGPREHRRELQHHLPVDRERALVERGRAPRHPAAAAESGAGQGRCDQGCGAVPRRRARRRPRGDAGHRRPRRAGRIARLNDAAALAELQTLGQLLRARGDGRRRKSHRDRHLIDRGRLRRRSVPRHHRDRQVDGRSSSRGRTSSSASSTRPTSSTSSTSPPACRATRSRRSPRR